MMTHILIQIPEDDLREFLIIKINDRIPMNEQNPSMLNEKLKKLFDHSESIMQD